MDEARGAAATIDVQRAIDARRLSRYQLLVLTLCFLVMTVDGFDTAVAGYVAPSLAAAWTLAPAQLAPFFAAGLAGLTVGSFVIGPIADRIGRRPVALLSVTLFGGLSLVSAAAPSLDVLVGLRFLIGLGLGGAMPNAYTTAAEFCPATKRALLVAPIGCGIPLGGVLGGLLAAPVIDGMGWRAMLALGGALPLALALLLWRFLPESPRYLIAAGADPARVTAILQRLAPHEELAAKRFIAGRTPAAKLPLRRLFGSDLFGGTVLLWTTAFLTLLVVYFLTNWLPTLFRGAGASLRQASLLTAMYLTGNTAGAILLGFLMDRVNPQRVLALAFLGAAVSLALLGHAIGHPWLLALALLVTGTGTGGAMTGLNILAAGFYPTASRATGVSWTLALGRVGSVVGSLIGGAMLSAQWGLPGLFVAVAVPILAAAASILALDRWRRRRGTSEEGP